MESEAQIPLLDRAAIIVAASIWYHEDVIETTRKLIHSGVTSWFSHESLVRTEKRVTENIRALPLTAITKQRVQHFSIFVGKNIQNWTQNHHFLTIGSKLIPSVLCWNPKGIIDCIETAKKVISHERSIIIRFVVACLYCFENNIFQLWDLVEHHVQCNTNIAISSLMESFEVKFWTSYMKHSINALMDEMQYLGNRDTLWFAFNMSVTQNIQIWIEHFLKKMRDDQVCIVAYSKLKCILERATVFHYCTIPLLSLYVSNEMLDDLILRFPGTILEHFLHFPYTSKFIEISCKTCNLLSGEDVYRITETFGHRLQEFSGAQIFKKVLKQFWRDCPNHCKTYVIQKCISGGFLIRLSLRQHSSPIIKLIIQSSTTDQRKEMVFSYNGILFFHNLVKKNRLGCLSMSVQQLVGSEDRENWIDRLISNYKQSFKIYQHSLMTTDFEKLINILENQKDKSTFLKE